MVNHGMSRACVGCKQKRKKCDEGRPTHVFPARASNKHLANFDTSLAWLYVDRLTFIQACQRCLKRGDGCFYPNTALQFFRHEYDDKRRSATRIRPRKCADISLLSQPSSDRLDQKVDIDQLAITICVEEYTAISQDLSVSRGYLSSLRAMILMLGPGSIIAESARLVGLVTLGNKLQRPDIVRRASVLYPYILRSFQLAISKTPSSSTVESLTTIVLLGLYERLLSCPWGNEGQEYTTINQFVE
ncbi:hypothetical protein LTR84_000815 [Exophiala bonariae]|uniref:Zn(2)-C6 fungal-type domain-containing protein n=1 Tax=Exophiala bonariae TaxID=1690606 RepID=A0AAV9NVM9_9EURO|nr:hypothetical protein LTR84_000815 [Exophiala bonariae]